MIKSIDFVHYRKIKGVKLNFKPGINVISGQNGTCKSSILHIIGNSYQKIKQTNPDVDTKLFNIIKKINQTVNPKIETLTKGDKKYNDPAVGVKGTLYTVEYEGYTCDFRRHNNTQKVDDAKRYRLIPKYPQGQKQTLEERAVIYLGLTRIVPIGELGDITRNITSSLPPEYERILISEYKHLTSIDIDNIRTENSNDVKIRSEFTTQYDGVDSNTISAGEDNIFIVLTALISLRWLFYETGFGSTLLIDEIDATLHPSVQYKLFLLIKKYSDDYKIQVFFTTHSLYLLEKTLKFNQNLLYLTSQAGNTVSPMEEPDIYRINMFLTNETRLETLSDKKIPIFTEDAEARILLTEIFDDLSDSDDCFSRINNYFHFVDINLGSDSLRDLFNDRFLNKTTLKAICILDGDKTDVNSNKNVRVLSLPQDGSPEQIVFNHLVLLYNDADLSSDFWVQHQVEREGFSVSWLQHNNIINDVEGLIERPEREKAKKIFNKYKVFFILVFRHWLSKNKDNASYKKFLWDLNLAFKATATENSINPNSWDFKKSK
ncbi:AAA family ATPase [Marinomonas sp. 5E14-1]|uniref:ATP-dependent nuclease n=1 Tax=Marinomonas sp. 5E14-1 TaxID=3153922 RepID=UPI0032643B92